MSTDKDKSAGTEAAEEEYAADRSAEAASAQEYADAGIMGAPGSEVSWPDTPEPRDEAAKDRS